MIFLFLVLSLRADAQDGSLSGRWTGSLQQQQKDWSFVMSVELLESRGEISGTLKCIAPNDGYAIYTIKGTVNGDQVRFSDITVVDENISTLANRLCIKNYSGVLRKEEDKWVIQGSWENNGTRSFANGKYFDHNFICLPGVFMMEKTLEKKLPAVNMPSVTVNEGRFLERKVEVQKVFDVVSDSIMLVFYDNGTVDDDTISVYLNKQPIVRNQRLTATALNVPIRIDPGADHEILMFAENVGSIPPNTALLVFYDQGKRYEVTIDSDTGKNGTVILRRSNRQ